jgi:protein TonB
VAILSGLGRWRALGIATSCLLHVGLIAGVLATEQWMRSIVFSTPPILLAEIVTTSPAPSPVETDVRKPAPAPRRPSGLLSRLPLPHFSQSSPPPPVSPPPREPAPPAVAEAPASPSAPAATSATAATGLAPSSASATTAEGVGPAPASSTFVAAPSGEATAAVARITSARPQGGYQVRPSYPSSALRQGIQGTTMLKVHVLVDGRVGDVVVQQSAGHPDLDQAAVDAVRRWRFEPARRGSDPVAMWVLLPVEFQIR